MHRARRLGCIPLGALAVLPVAACVAPEPADAPAGLARGDEPARQDPIALHAQDSFTAWADALPEVSELPPMQMRMNLAMAGSIADVTGEDLNFDGTMTQEDMLFAMAITMSGEMQDWRHFRARMDFNFDLGVLREQSGGRPTVVGCDLVGDGETLWIQPDWTQAWFLDEMRGEGVGVENMVFSVRFETLKEFLDAAVVTVPEENRELVQMMFDCAANPACLARLIARSATIQSFERVGDRILADVAYQPEFWSTPEEIAANPFLAAFGADAWRYRMEFDAATGANLRSSAAASTAAGAATGTMSFEFDSEVAPQGFPADRFRFEVPDSRRAFPVDLFLRPVIQEMRQQAGMLADPGQGDFEF